ncbi:PqqD family peptide modification chaperone [Candidatus Poribacteria bacterium]|nr:PqqD family peptide modification chaperone [Candidatus Poribacteria bacterium]
MNPISRFLIRRKMKKGGLKFTKSDVLKSYPVRNSLIKWDKNEKGEVSLVVPQKDSLWIKIITKIFMLPKSRVVALDEVGSFVWTMCDGHNSIDTIVRTLCNKYKLTRKEAEMSLMAYFRKLGKRGMVGFAVPKDAKEEIDKEIEAIS